MNSSPSLLPVFYHIAKNAGTYTLGWMMMLCRVYIIEMGCRTISGWTSDRIRRNIVNIGGHKQLTCVIYTPTDVHINNEHFKSSPNGDGNTDWVDLGHFVEAIESGEIQVFSVSVDPVGDGDVAKTMPDDYSHGYSQHRQALQLIQQAIGHVHLLNFTILRDPWGRAQSMYNYLTTNASAHEPNHGAIQAENFITYIQSDELEDGWFIRNLLNLSDDTTIEPKHLTACDQYLRYWKIKSIQNTDRLIDEVFHGAYGVMRSDVEAEVVDVRRNNTPNKIKIEFKELDGQTQQTFLDRTYWDRKLYERYCNS
jgi:hypothetical protein